MTTLRVTSLDDRSPFVVHHTGLSVAERAALGSAAVRAGLLPAGMGWAAEHPSRVVSVFAELGWDCDADLVAERGLADVWRATLDDVDGVAWDPPGMDLVRAQGCVPYLYQEVGSRRLFLAPGGLLLADAPGLGKTLQVLAALPSWAAVNVACPRNAVPTWEDEVAKWRPDLTVRTLKTRRSAVPAKPGEVVVGTLESMPALEWADVAGVATGAYLVCDEAHSLKGESAQAERFKMWSDAVRSVRGQVWLLSGTPVLNADPIELWRLLDACGRTRDTLGPASSLRELFKHTVTKVWVPRRKRGGAVVDGQGEYVEKVNWTGEHAAWVDDALARAVLRRTKEAVAPDMPALVERDLRVEVSAAALRELSRSDLARRLDAELAAIERAVGAGAAEAELDRLSAQPAVATARRLLATAKLPAAHAYLDDLAAAGEPVLCFSSHVAPVRDLGQRTGWAVIDGDVSGDRRGRIRGEFQGGAFSVGTRAMHDPGGWAAGVAMSIRAASESLTLTRAAYVLFLDRDFVPARNLQAIARAHRIGQRRSVTVTNLVAGHPVDRRISSILATKSRFGRTLLAGVEDR